MLVSVPQMRSLRRLYTSELETGSVKLFGAAIQTCQIFSPAGRAGWLGFVKGIWIGLFLMVIPGPGWLFGVTQLITARSLK